MTWYLMCRYDDGDLNHKVKVASHQAGRKLIESIEKKQTCTLTHTVESYDNLEEELNG